MVGKVPISAGKRRGRIRLTGGVQTGKDPFHIYLLQRMEGVDNTRMFVAAIEADKKECDCHCHLMYERCNGLYPFWDFINFHPPEAKQKLIGFRSARNVELGKWQ